MPTLTDQDLLALASSHVQAGRLTEAEQLYRELARKYPLHAELLNEIGVLALRADRPTEARPWFEQAAVIDPGKAEYRDNLGSVHQTSGDLEQALHCYEQALALDPTRTSVHYKIGFIRLGLGDRDSAAAHFQYVIEHAPEHGDAYLNLGHVLLLNGETERAIAVCRQGLGRLPDHARLWNNLGNALKFHGDAEGAIAAYGEALRRNPADALAANNLGELLLEGGRVDEAVESFQRSLASDPNLVTAHSNLIFAWQFQPDATVEVVAEECGRWWRQHGAPLRTVSVRLAANRKPDDRLRIGYVSPDLRDHPLGRHLLPVMREFDTAQFEVVAYSDAQRVDAMTAEFEKCALRWRPSACWSDEQLASEIRRDGVDILVDLALHSAGNRLPVFARQPAPVQVSFGGYPGSTGLETIGWRITDRFLDPLEDERSSGEMLVRLPDSFWCFDPLGETPAVSALPALETGVVTFGCLSKFGKVNGQVLECWTQILRQVPRSRLLLLCDAGEARARVEAAFREQGVTRERIRFTARLPRAEYFALHQQLDLVLDPFPYNGHMTTCDALWMGVPVVSLAGHTPVSRGGFSLLSNVGLPELVATTLTDYVRRAVELAGDPPRLAALRAGLRDRMRHSPLMDVPRFTRGLEGAYRAIWKQAGEGGSPATTAKAAK